MSKEQIFEDIYSDIRAERDNGYVVIPTYMGPRRILLEHMMTAPVESVLYDLGLDEAYLATIYKEDPIVFTQMMAINTLIKHLYKKYTENGQN